MFVIQTHLGESVLNECWLIALSGHFNLELNHVFSY